MVAVRISLHLLNSRRYAVAVFSGALGMLLATMISGCAIRARKQPPPQVGQTLQLRPIPAADLAAINAKVAEAQAAAADLHARLGQKNGGQ
jgi:hypothetical protein